MREPPQKSRNLMKFQKLEKANKKEKFYQQYKIYKDKTLKDEHIKILLLPDKKSKSKSLNLSVLYF